MTPLSRLLPALVAAVLFSGCGGASRTLPYPDDRTAAAAAPKPEPPAPGTQQQIPIDLQTALRLAAGSHLDVLEARARIREAEGRASSADGYLLPILSVGGTVVRNRGNAQSSFGELREVEFGTVTALGTIRISTNLGESIYRDLAAHRQVDVAMEFEAATLQRTLLGVALDYISLVETDSIVRIQDQFVQEAQSLLRLTLAREALGLGTSLDAERARAQAAAAEQRLLAARNDRQRRSKALASALRLDSTMDLAPLDKDLAPATLVNPSEGLPQWLLRASEGRPEGRGLVSNRMAAEEEARAARWAMWGPELSAGASAGVLGASFVTLDERATLAVGLGWTFSFGGPGRIDAADARAEQAGIVLQRFTENLRASVAGAFQELALSRQRLDPAERELTAAEKALKIARATYEGGLVAETDLLLAQQAADQARLRRLSAVARFNESQIRLLAEAGVASLDTFTTGNPK